LPAITITTEPMPNRRFRSALFNPVVLAATLLAPLSAFPLSATAAPSARPVVLEAPLRAHLSFLADDLLEGRGTGQRGGELAVRYLETQAASIGLQPAAGGSYRQKVELVGQKTQPGSVLRFEAGGKQIDTVFGTDVVFANGGGQLETRLDAPLVFVGYGIDAPDEGWNDFQGADVKGKLLVAMVNDPQPTAAEPNRFGGKSLTWYGRWTYKFEEALRQGAAGVLLIHTTASASYPWSVPVNSFTHEQFHLAGPGNALQGWISEGRGAQPVQGRRPGPGRLARPGRSQGFPAGRAGGRGPRQREERGAPGGRVQRGRHRPRP
jgi:hypothetical protein